MSTIPLARWWTCRKHLALTVLTINPLRHRLIPRTASNGKTSLETTTFRVLPSGAPSLALEVPTRGTQVKRESLPLPPTTWTQLPNAEVAKVSLRLTASRQAHLPLRVNTVVVPSVPLTLAPLFRCNSITPRETDLGNRQPSFLGAPL